MQFAYLLRQVHGIFFMMDIMFCRAERLEIFDEFEEWNMIQVQDPDSPKPEISLACWHFQVLACDN